ncbi:MAG: FGGY family carbohydrate kinase [Kiritimatiellae bacterium]|nr:FGGY family carbohydrate kinase [Kiritimatiellia bacterium]
MKKPLVLGIDIGTGKTAVAVLKAHGDFQVLYTGSCKHNADIKCRSGRSEQDVNQLRKTAVALVRRVPKDLRNDIVAIGLTGQMHGVLLLDSDGYPVSPLVTWQDRRCLENAGFLPQLEAKTGRKLYSGYGCATLAWLALHDGIPHRASSAATIHDYIGAWLCGIITPVTDPTDAASWGLFDIKLSAWNTKSLKRTGIPIKLLPQIVPSSSEIGLVSSEVGRMLGIHAGIPVTVAIGDNQASLVATLTDPESELALTLGTGGQLTAVIEKGRSADPGVTSEIRPFTGGRVMIVAASLAGGSAWAWLAQTAASWAENVTGKEVSLESVYNMMNKLGAKAENSGLVIKPSFLGERFDESLRGTISGISMDNFSLGAAANSLAQGMIQNLVSMLPVTVLKGRRRVVGSGNALRHNPLLGRMVREVLGLPLVLPDMSEEAACGAALNTISIL